MTTGPLQKRASGLPGLDFATSGGLPAAGATLIYGCAGAGKTVLGLQITAAALRAGERAVFISFEEAPEQLAAGAGSFAWGPGLLRSGDCKLIDARPDHLAASSGAYDLGGLLALLDSEVAQGNLAWVVLDALDRLLQYHPDPHAALAEMVRINDWARRNAVSVIFTAKEAPDEQPAGGAPNVCALEFALDTVLRLSIETVNRRQNRRFMVRKYRGSKHSQDELPVVMDDDGIHMPYYGESIDSFPATGARRVSTGIEALDEVLGGGLWAGSTTLISGKPGTAKTTLAMAFSVAAAARGEKTLVVSFDEVPDRIIRNAASVGFDLQPLIDRGLLAFCAREAWRSLVEEHYITIQRQLDALGAHCLVIDPISALAKAASAEGAYIGAERILSLARARGITTMMTSLADLDSVDEEATLSHTSTLVENWIALGYESHAGERNRSLSVVKARGTAHSNQVRELVLSDSGVTLAEPYLLGSEVLMGTARVAREAEERAGRRERQQARSEQRQALEQQLNDTHREAERLQARLTQFEREAQENDAATETQDATVRRRRGAGRNEENGHD